MGNKLIHDGFCQVYGYRKADPNITAATRKNGGVDPNQISSNIDQGAATIARVNSGVGLNEILISQSVTQIQRGAAFRTYDP